MDVLGSTNQVELSLFRTQNDEERQVRALASGLRVVSASDDPSGLAISETINSRVAGLQQGVQNVQDANNLLSVADSTLASVQNILTRIHSLVVEAANDFNSDSQLNSIQSEIDTLLREINKIAGSANFNGVTLLNGSLCNTPTPDPKVTLIASQGLPGGGYPTGTNVVNYDGSGKSGPLVGAFNGGNGAPSVPTIGALPAYVSIRVIGYDPNAVDPDSGMAVGPADYVQMVAYANSPLMGAAPLYMDTVAVNVNNGSQITNIQTIAPSGAPGAVLLDWSLANLTPADVGASMTFETSSPNTTQQRRGSPLSVNFAGQEGSDVQISLPTVSTAALNLTGINVLPSQVVNFNNQVSGTASNEFTTADAEARVQMALDTISQVRAQVGAQTVALRENADDSSVQIVNQIASESAIRDIDVGAATTQFTKDQVLSQIDTSVMAQMQANASLVVQLVRNSAAGGSGLI